MAKEVLTLKKGEVLINEGDVGQEMYYVTEGTLAVFKNKSSTRQQIGTIYSGELVGEMSFLDHEPRCATVEAISDCVLTVIPHEHFEKFVKGQPHWYQALIKTLLERLRKANARIKI